MAVATPGAGKTTFALTLARELFDRGVVRKLTVVAPTEHLKKQWADAAAKVGIPIDPNFKNADVHVGRQYKGVALTYSQVANKPQLHARNTENDKTLVIFDEIHHAGDALSWGDGLREAFDEATRRLALTGTPFRSDASPIPFVTYEQDHEGIRRSRADYSYGYGPALKDHVVRPVIFMAYSGQMRWRTSAGEEMAANLGKDSLKILPPRHGAPHLILRVSGFLQCSLRPINDSPKFAALFLTRERSSSQLTTLMPKPMPKNCTRLRGEADRSTF